LREPIKLKNLPKEEHKRLIQRSIVQLEEIIPKIIPIVEEVKRKGDKAVLKFTEKFDKVVLSKDSLKVSRQKLKDAYKKVSSSLVSSLEKMREQVEDFHRHQLQKDYFVKKDAPSLTLGQKFSPMEKVAIYVPGGKAPYPSTAIMGCVPAKLAGVKEVIVCSPPSPTGDARAEIMLASYIGGADLLVNAGGAQAIAALAYGTESIPKVDFIAGAGNVYVTSAKVYLASLGRIGIDCPAGPSEILIIADNTADPSYITWDMLSQAEHDETAWSVLITDSENLAWKVYKQINVEIEKAQRKNIICSSLEKNGFILLVDDLKEAVEFANQFAPEHLEIITEDPDKVFSLVKNAGSVFLGPFSPVAAGDYFTGTNHILPTGGAARFFSGLSVASFLKRISYQKLTREALFSMKKPISHLADQEGFQAHKISIEVRR